jgi:hypothetical protein
MCERKHEGVYLRADNTAPAAKQSPRAPQARSCAACSKIAPSRRLRRKAANRSSEVKLAMAGAFVPTCLLLHKPQDTYIYLCMYVCINAFSFSWPTDRRVPTTMWNKWKKEKGHKTLPVHGVYIIVYCNVLQCPAFRRSQAGSQDGRENGNFSPNAYCVCVCVCTLPFAVYTSITKLFRGFRQNIYARAHLHSTQCWLS